MTALKDKLAINKILFRFLNPNFSSQFTANRVTEIVLSKTKLVYLMLIKTKKVKKITIVAAKRIFMLQIAEINLPLKL